VKPSTQLIGTAKGKYSIWMVECLWWMWCSSVVLENKHNVVVYRALRVIYLTHIESVVCITALNHNIVLIETTITLDRIFTPPSYLQPLTKLYHHHPFHSFIHSPSPKPIILIFLLLQPALGTEPFIIIHDHITSQNQPPILTLLCSFTLIQLV